MSVPNPATTKWVPLWNTGAASPAGAGMFTGDLIWSVLATRPGSVPCDGALYNSVTDNTFAALYAAIGTTYGGTGPSSFAVPDVRGRLLVCKGVHADVDAEGDSDGLAVASRTPVHNSTPALTFTGIYQNTTDVSNNHTHHMEVDTGYVSSDHAHYTGWHYWQGQGYGTDVYPHVSAGMAAGLDLGVLNPYSSGISANHTHHISGDTGINSASHVHGHTAAGTIGGTVGPGGPRPADRPSYIVENCFIVK